MPTTTGPVWFLHFYKEETIARGKPTWALYFNGICHPVHEIDILVSSRTRIRSRQPVAVIHGRGYVTLDSDSATITEKETQDVESTESHLGIDEEQALSMWECHAQGDSQKVQDMLSSSDREHSEASRGYRNIENQEK